MYELEVLTDKNVEASDRNLGSLLKQMLVLSATLIVLFILISILLSKRISRPIKRMTQKVSEIDGEKILFEMEELFRTGDEIETLAAAFEAMSQKIQQYITDIVEISTQKERMETELKVATEIQSSMLPKKFPLFPDRTEFDVYASMYPAREVGGDFYDIFMTDENHLALVVGDASEKGVPAALFMVISKAYIRTRALIGGKPGEILTDVNKLLAEGNEKKMFATVWLAILEISSGRLVYANAGHEKLVIKRADKAYALDYTKHNFVLGGMKNVSFSDYELTLEHGDRIFMYSDGLTEAHKDVQDLFGAARMLEVLNKNSQLSPAELIFAVKAEVDSFVGNAVQFDDMTMLALEYK
jgi:sigma-B regulation protein RsbU (phosphoserine phosphatase)